MKQYELPIENKNINPHVITHYQEVFQLKEFKDVIKIFSIYANDSKLFLPSDSLCITLPNDFYWDQTGYTLQLTEELALTYLTYHYTFTLLLRTLIPDIISPSNIRKALSEKKSPFQTYKTLKSFIAPIGLTEINNRTHLKIKYNEKYIYSRIEDKKLLLLM